MRRQGTYRFSILNRCDITETHTSTAAGAGVDGHTFSIEIDDTSNLAVGDWVTLIGWEPLWLNIVAQITQIVNGTVFHIDQHIPDGTLIGLGTVNKLAGWRPVTPLNFYETKFSGQKQSDEIFFRKALDGKLTFDNKQGTNDWDYFLNNILPNECCEVKFLIEKLCDSVWRNEFNGRFSASDCIWNESACNVQVDIQIDDAYSCLKDNEGDGVNILPDLETHTVNITNDVSIEEFICCAPNVAVGGFSYQPLPTDDGSEGTIYGRCDHLQLVGYLNDFAPQVTIRCNNIDDGSSGENGFTYVKTVITNIVISDPDNNNAIVLTGDVCTTYRREVLVTIDMGGAPSQPPANGGNTWFQGESFTIDGYPATKWYRCPTGCPSNWGQYVVHNGLDGFITTRNGDCTTIQVEWPTCETPATPVAYTQGRSFGDACTYIAQKFCADGIKGIRSDFFEINPPGDTVGYVAGTNYVTGEPNGLKNMLIYQKSDILYPNADEHASIGEMSFQELETLWRVAFNAYWFVDDDGYMRVEHISWFHRTAVIDTTVAANQNNLRNKSLKIFSFDKVDVPIREEFTWMEENDLDFVGLPIRYSPLCSNPKNVAQYSVDDVTTDVDMILNIPTQIDPTGFVLISVDQNDNSQINREAGRLTGVVKNNAYLSWANLHYNFHRHYRWIINGYMNGVQQDFLSARPIKRQTQIKYIGECCVAINTLTDLVTTELGDGQIDKISKDNKNEMYSFELLFP